MDDLVVTVKRLNEARVRDIQVAPDIEITRLSLMVAAALQWDRDALGQQVVYQIRAEPPGRLLQPGETLSSAGVINAAWLVFIPMPGHELSKSQEP